VRDLFFLAALPFLLYAMAKRPFIAVGLWVWTAMFFPNGWLYGVASVIRYNLLFTAVAVLGYLAMRDKPKVRLGALGALVLAFFLWTTLTTAMTIGRPDVAWEIWSRFAKVVLLFLFIVMVIDKKLHFDFLLWCVALSIGFYGCLEALKFIGSGGGHMIEGMPGHVLGDRNELAVAFVMALPLCFYLLEEYGRSSKWIRIGLLGTLALLVIAIVGTQSRGGFIALLAVAGYMFVKSERKFLLGSIAVVLVAVLASLISQEWLARMDTIQAAGQDQSFMGRVVAWKLSFILAMDNPLVGGGFKSLENFVVWDMLSRDFMSYSFFSTGDALPDTRRAHAAHSIYFQVLGDHGFVGLALYLGILWTMFRKAAAVAREARTHALAPWIARLAVMLQLSIFAFALGGAALSFAYFDLIFAIGALVVVLQSRIVPRELKA
jgi:probable O-glycosylation ligase (exosortase A-associated)